MFSARLRECRLRSVTASLCAVLRWQFSRIRESVQSAWRAGGAGQFILPIDILICIFLSWSRMSRSSIVWQAVFPVFAVRSMRSVLRGMSMRAGHPAMMLSKSVLQTHLLKRMRSEGHTSARVSSWSKFIF